MIIKTPVKYISGDGVLAQAGEHIKEFTQRPLIVGSRKALAAAKDTLVKTLDEYNIDSSNIEEFSGYPSETQFAKFKGLIQKTDADAIIAVGGGRVLDTCKATAELAGVPVITVPTIAATCAAWAGLTIQYDDEGAFVKARPLKSSPVLVIADTRIILSAPERYLFAGVADTFAKFYEIRPSFEHAKDSVTLDIALYASQVAFDKLESSVFKALEEAKQGIYSDAATDVVDAVIYLAGFAGSFQSNRVYYSFAHPFYHISSRFPSTRHKLHGEKVAYGILAQLYLEKKSESEIDKAIRIFEHYNNAYTLDEIGFDRENTDELERLAEDVKREFPYVTWDKEEIVNALLDADEAVRTYRRRESKKAV
jgi:glycerol dehydrogenase